VRRRRNKKKELMHQKWSKMVKKAQKYLPKKLKRSQKRHKKGHKFRYIF